MKVAIIGAGVAGLGIAWRLAGRGVQVVVLERAEAGSGATSVAAGMIAPIAEYGDAQTPEAVFARQAGRLWPGYANELEAASGLPLHFRQSGALLVAQTSEELAGLKERIGAQNGVSVLGSRETRAMEPRLAEANAGALWAAEEAQIDTPVLARALKAAVLKAGGEVRLHEPVERIEIENGRAIGVRTPSGVIRADAVVLAAGAWSSRMEGLPYEAVPPVYPVKGEVLVLTPPSSAQMPKHLIWGYGIYLVPRHEGLLVGATVEHAGYDLSSTKAAEDWLLRQARALMPALETWRVSDHRVGLRPASPDGMPILGASAVDGLFIASGQYRNGILFAPAVVDVLCRLVLEQVLVAPSFDPKRFSGVDAVAKPVRVTAHGTP